MRDERKTKAQIIEELEGLRRRCSESERSIAGFRQVAKGLEEVVEMYRSLVENTSDWIWEVDRDGIYTYVNPKATELLGYEPEEIIGRTPFDFMPPDEAKRVAEAFAAIAREKRPFLALEKTNVAKDGHNVVLETSGVPILDDQGNLLGYRGIDRDITEHRKIEEALHESEKRFHAMSEASFEGIYIHATGEVLACNLAFASMLGYEPSEIVGTDALRFVKREYLEGVKTRIREGYEGAYEIEMVRRDGSTFMAEVRARNITYSGRPVWVTAVRDVTERKQYEDRILRQTALLQGIIRVLREALTSHTDREVAQICVAAAVEILRSELCICGELNERGRFDTLACSNKGWEACKASVEEAWQRSMDMVPHGLWVLPVLEGKSVIIDEPSAHPASAGSPEGHPWIGSYLGVPLRHGDKIIGMIAVANKEGGYNAADREDLEALSVAFVEALYHKRAESELEVHRHRLEELVEERASELRAAQERFSVFMETAPCSFSLWDSELRLLDANECGLRWFSPGAIKESVIGNNICEIDPYIGQSGLIDRYRRAIEAGEPFHFDDLVSSPRFGDRHLSVKSFKVGDGMGTIIEDITERARSEEALKRYAEDLARSNAELEQFAYVASHDLQEPLRMVASYLQLLEKRYAGALDKDAGEFIAYAVDGSIRMQNMINDLLAYSRVGTRGEPLRPTSCDRVIRQVINDLRLAIDENGAEVTYDPLPEVSADETQLVRLFHNLILNSIKFRGDAPPRIHVSAEIKGAEWEFAVSDNGIGIEPEFHERIFRVFERLHTGTHYPGTGIGLALAKKVVERHGGRIWLESGKGEGTTFYFTIPAEGK